jgi:hypothetical protein
MLLLGDPVVRRSGEVAPAKDSEDAREPLRDPVNHFGMLGAADRFAFAACLPLCCAGKVAAF